MLDAIAAPVIPKLRYSGIVERTVIMHPSAAQIEFRPGYPLPARSADRILVHPRAATPGISQNSGLVASTNSSPKTNLISCRATTASSAPERRTIAAVAAT